MEEKILNTIDNLLMEGNGYIDEPTRNLVYKLAMKQKVFKQKEAFNAMVDRRIVLYDEKENCPNCGAEKSKVLHVCDACGYVMPGAHHSAISVQTLVENLETSIETVNSVAKPTLISLFKEQLRIIFPYLTIWSLVFVQILQINYDLELMYIFVALFAFLSVVSLVFKKTKDKLNRKDVLIGFLQNIEYIQTVAKRHFGNEQSVKDLLISYQGKINVVKNHKKMIRKNLLIIYGLLIFVTVFLLFSVPWTTYEEIEQRLNDEQMSQYRNESLAETKMYADRFKQLCLKRFVLQRRSKSIYGPLADRLILKSETIHFKYLQAGIQNEMFRISVDSVLVETTKKFNNKRPFDLELCGFDKDGKPAFYNTILKCVEDSNYIRMLNQEKGPYYLNFQSDSMIFGSNIDMERSLMDMDYYEKAVTFNLVSRFN